jgi:hypothetical protein
MSDVTIIINVSIQNLQIESIKHIWTCIDNYDPNFSDVFLVRKSALQSVSLMSLLRDAMADIKCLYPLHPAIHRFKRHKMDIKSSTFQHEIFRTIKGKRKKEKSANCTKTYSPRATV